MKNDVCVDIYHSGTWHSLTAPGRVYARDAITMPNRGRPDRATRVVPTQLQLTINNRDGEMSPRNPLSSLYGLIGRNTPIRVYVRSVGDLFDRTETNGWGSAPNGSAWTTTGGAAADFSVTGGAGLQSHTAVVSLKGNVIAGWSKNADVSAASTLPVSSPVGGSVSRWVCARWADASNYYVANLSVTTAGDVRLGIFKRVGGVISAALAGFLTVGTGHTAGDEWVVRFRVHGDLLRAKAWRSNVDEPAGWDLEVTDTSLTTGTSIAVLSRLEAGYAGVTPLAVSWTSVEAKRHRFTGYVESWPQRWSMDGRDAWVPITAYGLLQRLNAPGSNAPAWSPMTRSIRASSTRPFAWWPMESTHTGDTATTDTLPSPIPGCGPLYQTVAGASFGKGHGGPGCGPVPDFRTGGTLDATIPDDGLFNATTGYTMEFTARFDNNASALAGLTAYLFTPGPTPGRFDMSAVPDMNCSFGIIDGAQLGSVNNSPTSAYDGRTHHYRLTVQQSGADVAVSLYVDGVLVDSEPPGTVGTVNRPKRVSVQLGNLGEPAADQASGIGQLTFWHGVTPPIDTAAAATGYDGETAVDRLTRLCAEAGIPLEIIGDGADSAVMGPQQLAPLVDLFHHAAEADGGVLYEARDVFGLVYVTHAALYNQTAVVTVAYTDGNALAPGLVPLDDTKDVVNVASVERMGGTTATVERDTGPLSTAEPPDGVGRIEKKFPLNLQRDDQALQQAAWKLHLGTWDEPRYPVVPFNLGTLFHKGYAQLADDLACLDVAQLFAITDMPVWADDLSQHAQGFSEDLGTHTWMLRVNSAPAGPYRVLTYGTGRYDARATTTNEVLSVGETSLDVLSTDDTRWSDTAVPYDILVGGERMTVTACTTPASASQTMTVTRTLAKEHPTGSPVRVADPLRYAK